MNILVDLNHPVDVNFFKNAVMILDSLGHNISVAYRPRGKLEKIVLHELDKYKPFAVGTHKQSFIGKLFGQLERDLKFLSILRERKIDLSIGFGPNNVLASRILGIPYLAFDDDFEYKIPFYHARIFATRHIMPSYIKKSGRNIYKYDGLKELAYLHPRYFKADRQELERYSLSENEYVFIREISGVSLNYKDHGSAPSLATIVEKVLELNLKIVLSLEDDSLADQLRNRCILLTEPVNDIYSLMNYALFTISSGDTVARESSLLGTPTIYTGGRDMVVNQSLIAAGFLYKEDTLRQIITRIEYLNSIRVRVNIKSALYKMITTSWENTTEVILHHIKEVMVLD